MPSSLELISIGFYKPDPIWALPSHKHPINEMIVVLRGSFIVEIAGQKINAATGDVLIYPEKQAHREYSNQNNPVETICFAFGGNVGDIALKTSDIKGRIRVMADWMYQESRTANAMSIDFRQNIFKVIIEELKLLNKQNKSELVSRITFYIENNIEKQISLDNLADCADMSKYHFLRLYKTLTGRTPMDFLMEKKLKKARQLVMTTNLPLKAIAPRCGISNQYYLCRLFRKKWNLTPGYFRKKFG